MFNDIVDYAEHVQKDRPLAQLLLEKYREILRQGVSTHRGHEIKTFNDEAERTGLKGWVAGPQTKGGTPRLQSGESMVEFEDPLDATLCAIDIQRALHEHNHGVPRQREIRLRIGIHFGDVERQQRDVFGEAVNIASRIELLAEPGGICLTEQVHDQIRHRTELHITKLAPTELEGVELKVGVYKIMPSWERGERRSTGQSNSERVAILPFANISADPSDEYFSDGLTEELISTLSKVRELSVISRTSVMQYKNKAKPIPEIGRELNAGTILEGSVRRGGNRVRITIQMIDAMKDKHLWAESYDREIQDIFAVQSDIAQRVAEVLRVQLLSSERQDIERRATDSTEAFALYLKGRYHWNERTRYGNDRAVRYFEEAVKLDPEYALAYAGLSDCYIIYADYGLMRPMEAYPKSREYAQKAIEIDPRLAEPHASLGLVYNNYEHRWPEAEEELKQAIELKPSYATASQWYGFFLQFRGRIDEAYDQIKRAKSLDPLSAIIGVNWGDTFLFKGQYKDSIEQYKGVLEDNGDFVEAHHMLGWAYYLDSQPEAAVDEMRKAVALSGGNSLVKGHLICLLGFLGRRDEANNLLEELNELSKSVYVPNLVMVEALIGLGRPDEAFSYLERSHEEKSSKMLYLGIYPWYSAFRKDPRWAFFEARTGLR